MNERTLPELPENMILAKLEQVWLSDTEEYWRCSIRKLHNVNSYNGEGSTPHVCILDAIGKV